jgi:hypothetical protein
METFNSSLLFWDKSDFAGKLNNAVDRRSVKNGLKIVARLQIRAPEEPSGY